jgi:hypothetical protein
MIVSATYGPIGGRLTIQLTLIALVVCRRRRSVTKVDPMIVLPLSQNVCGVNDEAVRQYREIAGQTTEEFSFTVSDKGRSFTIRGAFF